MNYTVRLERTISVTLVRLSFFDFELLRCNYPCSYTFIFINIIHILKKTENILNILYVIYKYIYMCVCVCVELVIKQNL